MKGLPILMAALLVAACGSEPEPSVPAIGNLFRVDLREEHFGTIAAFVYDGAGIVLAASKSELHPLGNGGDAAAVTDVGSESMLVTWLGGACRFGPTVTLTGDAERLVVTVQPDAGGGLPAGVVCDDIGLFFAINLKLSTPVEQDAVTVRVVR